MPKIIITGASDGIGKRTALEFAALGWDVLAVARREKNLQELKTQYPDQINYVVADITVEKDRNAIVSALSPQDKGIYLIHNAGIAAPNLLDKFDLDNWNRHFALNITAPAALTTLLLKHLQDGGRVLNVSTALAHRPAAALAAYTCSKAALFMLKEQWNIELGQYNILFGSVDPGIVDTDIQLTLRSQNDAVFPSLQRFKQLSEKKQLLDPATVAKFIAWLMTSVADADFIKGDWNIYDPAHQQLWK